MRSGKRMARSLLPAALLGLGLFVGRAAYGQHDPRPGPPPMRMPPGPRPGPVFNVPGHPDISPHGAGDQSLARGDAGRADAGHGEEHHAAPFNFAYGLIAEREGAEPGLLFRPKGMPVPFLANLLNFGILVFLGVYFGKKPLKDSLVSRKETLMREIDEAAKVKAEASARLDEYKGKIGRLDAEVARISREYAEQGKLDQERLLREAKEKRARMKRDAEFLLEQESKMTREILLREAVDAASVSAEALLRQRLSAPDQDRLAQEYLQELGAMKLESRGG